MKKYRKDSLNNLKNHALNSYDVMITSRFLSWEYFKRFNIESTTILEVFITLPSKALLAGAIIRCLRVRSVTESDVFIREIEIKNKHSLQSI